MDKFRIEIPEFCLVALIGGTSSGKTSFAHRFFRKTEVLSSDFFRGMVCDDENSQEISGDAFDLLFYAANKRLDHMKLTVIDATNLKQSARKQVLDLAFAQNVHSVAIVLNIPEEIMQERNKQRADRNLPERVIRQHAKETQRCIRHLKHEGFRFVYVINSLEQLENTEIIRTKLWSDKRGLHGPFDVIGDIHGCCDELEMLLCQLGYVKTDGIYAHPGGRLAAFLGDFCDRGGRNADVLQLVMDMVKNGIEIAKAQGKYTGRKPIEIDWTRFGQLYGEWKSKSITGRDFMRRMGLSANTFYRRVREYESTHGIAELTSA